MFVNCSAFVGISRDIRKVIYTFVILAVIQHKVPSFLEMNFFALKTRSIINLEQDDNLQLANRTATSHGTS